jgi:hypothetical protein
MEAAKLISSIGSDVDIGQQRPMNFRFRLGKCSAGENRRNNPGSSAFKKRAAVKKKRHRI